MRRKYESLGWWKVTTQGDVEARTVQDLGTHYGFLDEIAFKLGSKAYYGLHFQAIDEPVTAKEKSAPVNCVIVQLGVDSGTWDQPPATRAETVRQILKDRPVTVGESSYYASFILSREQ
jgi:hypothetical protein